MTLEQKLDTLDSLCFTDRSGVIWRLPAAARGQAEQLLRDNPRLSLRDVLPCVPLEEPLAIPAW